MSTEHACSGPLRWCSLQDSERVKCDWMAVAGLAAGVTQPIMCLGAETGLACAKLVSKHQADLVVAHIDDAHRASMLQGEDSNRSEHVWSVIRDVN